MCCMPTGIADNASLQMTKLMRLLKICCVVQLGLGILNMWVSISSGLYMLIGALLLYMITCSKNWCTCVFYVVLCLMDFIQSVMLVGNYLAKNGKIESGVGVLLFFTLIKLPFYVMTMYYSFLAYRELKALFLEVAGASNQQNMQSFSRSWDDGSRRQDNPPPPQPPAAFAGSGYRLG